MIEDEQYVKLIKCCLKKVIALKSIANNAMNNNNNNINVNNLNNVNNVNNMNNMNNNMNMNNNNNNKSVPTHSDSKKYLLSSSSQSI